MQQELQDLKISLLHAVKKINLSDQKVQLLKLETLQNQEGFWDNVGQASQVSQKIAQYKKNISLWETVLAELDTLLELDADSLEELKDEASYLVKKANDLLLQTYFDGKFDSNNCILSVICGAGGDDAADFTQMLGRMYSRFFELKGWKGEVIEKSDVSISFKVEGEFAYGMLKCEHGVHRLVRLSPFNSGNTRETSFAMVDVIPVLEQSQEVFIDPADLRIDVFRASGAGGQHVNTTDSAVRITHLPTGIVVSSQAGRSQHSNKENAMTVLQGKLAQIMAEQNAAAINDLRGVKTEMAWGNQIRSYVLHPYKMVKDHRTGYEVSDPEKVLDGDLEGVIKAKLEHRN